MKAYQHPITFNTTGDVANDFRHSIADFDANLYQYLPAERGSLILDIGCGWGQFLYWLRGRGYTAAQGIDIGTEQVKYSRSIGLDVTQVDDPVAFLSRRPGQFEMITLHHVIEHMPAMAGLDLLGAIHQALRPGGSVIVQTPNMSAASAGFSRYIEISHLTGYTENSLTEIMALAGFSEIKVFGNKSPVSLAPRRLLWLLTQRLSRAVWRMMLLAELGSDAPRVLHKNLYGVGRAATS